MPRSLIADGASPQRRLICGTGAVHCLFASSLRSSMRPPYREDTSVLGRPMGSGGFRFATSRFEASLVFTRGDSKAAFEVAVEVTLISKAGRGGGRGDRFPGFEHSPSAANSVGYLQRVRG